VLLYQNDRVAKLAAKAGGPTARWTMANVNAIIASSLAGVLMPVEADRGANAGSRNCNLWELCATVCPCPGWKFAQAYSFPVDPESRASSGFAPRTPSSLPFADKLLATVPKFRTDKSPARTIAAQLVYVCPSHEGGEHTKGWRGFRGVHGARERIHPTPSSSFGSFVLLPAKTHKAY